MKFTSNITKTAGKTLVSNGSAAYCRTYEGDPAVYLCNGFMILKVNQLEYTELIQPATKGTAGNWTLQDKTFSEIRTNLDIRDLLTKCAEKARPIASNEFTRCPFENHIPGTKKRLAAYYNEKTGCVSFYNADYMDAFCYGATVKVYSENQLSGAVIYDGDEPIGMVLPVKPSNERDTAAVKAYFTAGKKNDDDAARSIAALRADVDFYKEELDTKTAEIENLYCELTAARDQIADMRGQIAALELQRDGLKASCDTWAEDFYRAVNELDELKAAAAIEPAPIAKAAPIEESPADPDPLESIPAVFHPIAAAALAIDGLTATVKGAKTEKPILWIDGDTYPRRDELKALGLKYSNKRKAWYIAAADIQAIAVVA